MYIMCQDYGGETSLRWKKRLYKIDVCILIVGAMAILTLAYARIRK